MRLPITDKFLWTLYNLIEGIEKIWEFGAPRTMREAVYPELYKFKCEWQRKESQKDFSRLIYYLKKKGLIKIESLKPKGAVILTKKGLDRIFKIKLKTIEKKKRKDGKCIMLIFDIPEKKRALRDLLREYLQFLGYKMLQKSIWICPYDVLKETEEFIARYSLDSDVRIFLIKEI